MTKALELAKKISKQTDKNWFPELEDYNLKVVFAPIFTLPHNIIVLNTIVAYIIFAYDSDSNHINLRQDRTENKKDILDGIGTEMSDEVYESVIDIDSDELQEVVWSFLKRQPDWKFKTIITCFDFHSKHIRSATESISSTITDDLEIAKINKAKGELLKEAIRQREVGEALLRDIKKDYVNLDHVTQSEFGFTATDVERIDIMSWRQFIKRRNKNKWE